MIKYLINLKKMYLNVLKTKSTSTLSISNYFIFSTRVVISKFNLRVDILLLDKYIYRTT